MTAKLESSIKNKKRIDNSNKLTLSNPIFLPTAYSPAVIGFGR
jgi:hypothetical protein